MSSPTTRVSIDTRHQVMATLRRLRPLCIHFYNNRRSRAVPSSVQYRAVPDEMDFYRHDLSSSRCASLSSSITIRFFLSYPTQSICRLLLRKHSRDWPCGDCRSDCGKIFCYSCCSAGLFTCKPATGPVWHTKGTFMLWKQSRPSLPCSIFGLPLTCGLLAESAC